MRHAFLCGPGHEHRKDWIEARLQELVSIFAIDVCGYSVMDNHLHVVVRLDPDRVKTWSNRQVSERWAKLYPPRDPEGNVLPVTEDWIAAKGSDAAWRRIGVRA